MLLAVVEVLLVEVLRRAVLGFLVGKGAVSGDLRCKLLGWRHSGFSMHNQVRVEEGDAAGRSKLAAYMLRAPMSLEKMIYDADTGTVIYRSKMPASAAEATGRGGGWGAAGPGGSRVGSTSAPGWLFLRRAAS